MFVILIISSFVPVVAQLVRYEYFSSTCSGLQMTIIFRMEWFSQLKVQGVGFGGTEGWGLEIATKWSPLVSTVATKKMWKAVSRASVYPFRATVEIRGIAMWWTWWKSSLLSLSVLHSGDLTPLSRQ